MAKWHRATTLVVPLPQTKSTHQRRSCARAQRRGLWDPAQYSISKCEAFERYQTSTSKWQAIGVLLVSSVPCVVVTLLLESIPLQDPMLGWRKNGGFLLRTLLGTFVVASATTICLQEFIPELAFSWRELMFISCTQSALYVATFVLLAEVTGMFPVPFAMVFCLGPMIGSGVLLELFAARHRIPLTPNFRERYRNAMNVVGVQSIAIIACPAYATAFTHLSSSAQIWFSLLLPGIKFALQTATRATAKTKSDVWTTMTGSVHQFHVLFTVVCIQNSKTESMIWIVLFWNAAQVIRGCYTIARHAREAAEQRDLQRRAVNSDASDSVGTVSRYENQASRVLSLLNRQEIVEALFQSDPDAFLSSYVQYQSSKWAAVHRELVHRRSVVRQPKASIRVSRATQGSQYRHMKAQGGFQLLSKSLRVVFGHIREDSPRAEAISRANTNLTSCVVEIRCLLQVFHASEYLLMRSYLSAMTYFLYAVYVLIVYSFGNREYIMAVMSLSSVRDIFSTMRTILFLLAVELMALGLYLGAMKLALGDSGLLQVAFVLSSQRKLTQAYMLTMTAIVFAMAGVHIGNDFTFEFKWLRH